MLWHKDPARSGGGRWRCAVQKREWSRRHRENHLEACRERELRYSVNHREAKREYCRLWRSRQPDEYREKERERSVLKGRKKANELDQEAIDKIYAENPWLKEMENG